MVKHLFLKRSIACLCIGVACSGIIIVVLITGLLKGIELKSLDFRFLWRGAIPVSDKVVIIGTDKESLNKIKDPFIFWSPFFSEVIKAVARGGSRAIGFDFLQTIALQNDVGGKDLDGIMTAALMEAENVIMINHLQWNETSDGLIAVNPLSRYLYAADPDNVGFSNLTIDNDGFVRGQTLLLNDKEGNIYAYFGLKIIAKYLNAAIEKRGERIYLGDYSIPVMPSSEMLINFAGPSGTFPVMSFYEVWKMASQGNVDFFREKFKDKIVLIGPGNTDSQDLKPTPYYKSGNYKGTRQTLGIEIVANVINTILERQFIIPLKFWQIILIIVFFGVLASFTSFQLSPVYGGVAVCVLAVGYLCLCIFLFNRYNIWLHFTHPIYTIPLTFAMVFTYRYAIEDKEKRRIKKIFKHYVSEDVVDEILKHTGEIPLGGHRTRLTVLFADIRGFTALSDNRDPHHIVSMLNLYFNVMVDVIMKHKGTLDKYIGDGILAFFGAPITRENHADLAVSAAMEMVSKLDDINKELLLDVPLRIGIGIHTGEAVVGNIGSRRKMEYTVIGDTVNTASRVEGLTKDFKATILITEDTFTRLKADYPINREKEIVLRGKTQPIMLYQVGNK